MPIEGMVKFSCPQITAGVLQEKGIAVIVVGLASPHSMSFRQSTCRLECGSHLRSYRLQSTVRLKTWDQ